MHADPGSLIIKFVSKLYAVSWFEIQMDNTFFNQQLYFQYDAESKMVDSNDELLEFLMKGMKLESVLFTSKPI